MGVGRESRAGVRAPARGSCNFRLQWAPAGKRSSYTLIILLCRVRTELSESEFGRHSKCQRCAVASAACQGSSSGPKIVVAQISVRDLFAVRRASVEPDACGVMFSGQPLQAGRCGASIPHAARFSQLAVPVQATRLVARAAAQGDDKPPSDRSPPTPGSLLVGRCIIPPRPLNRPAMGAG